LSDVHDRLLLLRQPPMGCPQDHGLADIAICQRESWVDRNAKASSVLAQPMQPRAKDPTPGGVNGGVFRAQRTRSRTVSCRSAYLVAANGKAGACYRDDVAATCAAHGAKGANWLLTGGAPLLRSNVSMIVFITPQNRQCSNTVSVLLRPPT
jgi:hypothetical protein